MPLAIPKVNKLNLKISGNHNIFRLEISMSDSSLVQFIDNLAKLDENVAHNRICLSQACIKEVNKLNPFYQIHIDIAYLTCFAITLGPCCIRD